MFGSRTGSTRFLTVLLVSAGIGSEGFEASGRPRPRNGELKTPRRFFVRHATIAENEAPESSHLGATPPDMVAFASGYTTVFEELVCKSCQASQGEVPDDLFGTYFRSGPAMFSAGSILPPKKSLIQPKQPPVLDGEDKTRMVPHPFEGDGAVLGVTFSREGDVTARFRFIRGTPFTYERKKGKRVYTGMDSTRMEGPSAGGGLANDLPLPLYRHNLMPGLNKLRKNTANSRAIYWGKRLFSLWEGGQPHKLDALALSTDGRSMLGGAIKKEADPFGGKMIYDPSKNRALFYAVSHESKDSSIVCYEFDDKFRLIENGRIETTVPGFALITDFAATENYAVFVQPPIATNGMRFLMDKGPGRALKVEDRPSIVHLIPRPESSKQQMSLPLPIDSLSDSNLHFINAYEDGGLIIFDVIRSDGSKIGDKVLSWPWGSSLEEYQACASKKSLWRYTIDTQRGSVSKKLMFNDHCFFGGINPAVSMKEHRYIYMNVGALGADVAPPQGIARFDCETAESQVWMPENFEFCGEPMYARRATEDGSNDPGYILSVLYNGKKNESELLILQANKIPSGPIARLPLDIAIPHGLFGCFSTAEEATSWSTEEIERRAKLADKMESKGNMWNEVRSEFSGLGLRFSDMDEYGFDFLF